jgi:hypothetical protein
MSSQNRKILLFIDLCAAHPQDTTKECETSVFPPNNTSILRSIDQGIIRSFKHYYWKQLVRKTISMIDCKLLHDTTLRKTNVLDAQHFIVEPWHCVTYTTIVNCFQKWGFNLNQTNDGEDAAELSIAKAD